MIADRRKLLSRARTADGGELALAQKGSAWTRTLGRGPRRPRPGGPPRPERVEERFPKQADDAPWKVLAVHGDGSNEVFSITDGDHQTKVFDSIRRQGRVSPKHRDAIVDVLRAAGQFAVVDVTVLGWEHVQPPVAESARAQAANAIAITRMSAGKHKSMTWLGIDRHNENLHRMNCNLTISSDHLHPAK